MYTTSCVCVYVCTCMCSCNPPFPFYNCNKLKNFLLESYTYEGQNYIHELCKNKKKRDNDKYVSSILKE